MMHTVKAVSIILLTIALFGMNRMVEAIECFQCTGYDAEKKTGTGYEFVINGMRNDPFVPKPIGDECFREPTTRVTCKEVCATAVATIYTTALGGLESFHGTPEQEAMKNALLAVGTTRIIGRGCSDMMPKDERYQVTTCDTDKCNNHPVEMLT